MDKAASLGQVWMKGVAGDVAHRILRERPSWSGSATKLRINRLVPGVRVSGRWNLWWLTGWFPWKPGKI